MTQVLNFVPNKTMKVSVEITYFKESGKWYATENIEVVAPENTPDNEIYDYLRTFLKSGEPNPGLSTTWEGFIALQIEETYPSLIIPGVIEEKKPMKKLFVKQSDF